MECPGSKLCHIRYTYLNLTGCFRKKSVTPLFWLNNPKLLLWLNLRKNWGAEASNICIILGMLSIQHEKALIVLGILPVYL